MRTYKHTYTFQVNMGSRSFVQRVNADSYALASKRVHGLYPQCAIISPTK